MDEEINKGNLNDYNNQGIDVTTSNRKDPDDCIFNRIKEEIQNATLTEATRKAERIVEDYIPKITNASNQKLNIEKETPPYINAGTIKRDMNEAERTMDDFPTETNNFPEEFNQENNWNVGNQINTQFNQHKENEFEQRVNNQFGQQKDNKIEQQSNNQFNRNNDWER